MNKKNILVLGVSGMLGSTLIRHLSGDDNLDVYGTVRDKSKIPFFSPCIQKKITCMSIDSKNLESLERIFYEIKPDYVINCIGIIKQSPDAKARKIAIEINALLPHLIAEFSSQYRAKLIHISTDCVFSGTKGYYREFDESDAYDIYGKSKFLGEVDNAEHLTLRTSIVGHELNSSISLLEWFLAQKNEVSGYLRALYSGVTTLELAKIIQNHILPAPNLNGLYHVSSKTISKFDLLVLINQIYKKNLKIKPENNFVMDRSLDSSYFQKVTGYIPTSWEDQIVELYKFNLDNSINKEKNVQR